MERFDLLMKATEKEIQLEEKRAMIEEKKVMFEDKKVEMTTASEDTKILTLKVAELDDDTRMIVQAVRFKTLSWRGRRRGEKGVDAEAEAAHMPTTTH